jgi:TonB-linked SusC/RagA family outer membrane protein
LKACSRLIFRYICLAKTKINSQMRKLVMTMMVSFGFALAAFAQTKIAGRVTDANGKPISNVSVTVKGTTMGTSTAADGTYSITAPAGAKSVEFSSIGFEKQSVSIASGRFSPVMQTAIGKEGPEVVITGITRVKRSEFAGASTKVDEKQIKNRPVGSFDQILQGRAPGLTLLTGSGAPGSASTVIIRGSGSILGGSDPFYVVDGIPVEAGVFQGLNPNDFASIDVLRDAAATSLYGSRASAGVIVVTTKKGSAGKMRVNYSAQYGVKTKPQFAFRPMNTKEILAAQEAYGSVIGETANGTSPTGEPTLPGWYYSTLNPRYQTLSDNQKFEEAVLLDELKGINTNWQDEVFRNGNFSNHQLSLSGGSGKTRVYSSLSLYNEEGITLRSDMNRVTLRNNFDFSDDRLSYSVFSNFGYTKRNFQQSSSGNSLGNPFLIQAIAVPYHNPYNADGSFNTGDGYKYSATNTLELTDLDRNYNNQLKMNVGFTAGYKITDLISAAITTGIDFRETQNSNYGSRLAFVRQNSTTPTGQAGFQSEGLTRFFAANVRPSVTFKKMFQEKHDLDVSVFGEYVREKAKSLSFTGFGTDPKRPNTPAAITQGNAENELYASVGGGKSENALLGGLLTAKYTYNSKYTFSGSFRRDASSKLPKKNREQNFFSLGAIWDAGKEDFMERVDFVNMLRVKLSYGSSGNANNFPGGDYPYQAPYTQGQYNGQQTIIAVDPGNPDLKWEVTYLTNLGIDYELFDRRIYGDINLYSKVTKDLFVQLSLTGPGGFGTGFPLNVNAGQLSNKGFEWNVNADVVRTKNLTWTLFTNGGYNKNNVDDLGGVTAFEQGTERVAEGLPLGSHYEVGWAGVDASSGAPLYYTANGKVTNVYNAQDAVQNWGTWEAPWRGGFGTNLSYKNFDLNILFTWQRGATKVDNMEYFVENPAGFLAQGFNQSSSMTFWQKPGDVVNTPSPLYAPNFSSKIIHDASFLRLRDVRLSYNLPRQSLMKTKFISNASVYFQAQNLYMWTKWRGLDPEAGAVNINLSEFPNPTSFTGGVEINF